MWTIQNMIVKVSTFSDRKKIEKKREPLQKDSCKERKKKTDVVLFYSHTVTTPVLNW